MPDVQLFKAEADSRVETELSAFAQRRLPMIEEHLRLAKEVQASLR